MSVRIRLAVAVGLTLTLIGLSPGRAEADSDTDIYISRVKATAGQLDLVLTGPGLAPIREVMAGEIIASANGNRLSAKVADASSASSSRLPLRGVVLAIDSSALMAGAPLAQVEASILDYIAALPTDVAIGVVGYSNGTPITVNPTRDRASVRKAMGMLVAKGSGEVFDAVRAAVGMFDKTYSERRIVLVTGSPDGGSQTTVAEASSLMKKDNVSIDVIKYGASDPGEPIRVLARDAGTQVRQAKNQQELQGILSGLLHNFPLPIAVTLTVPAELSGQGANLTVTVSAGGRKTEATIGVNFAVDPSYGPGIETVRLRVLPMVVLVIGLGLIGLAVVIIVFAGAYFLSGRSGLGQRLRQLERFGTKTFVAKEETPEGNSVVRAALAISERAVQKQGSNSIEAALDRAGVALRPAEWMLVRAAVTVATAFISALLVPWFLGVSGGGGLGWFISQWYLKSRTTRRARKFAELLPDALQLVVGALRSGFSLLQAVDAVVREGPEPVAGEFGRAMAEIRLGGEIEAALERTAQRNGSRDLSWLVMAIRIQRDVGGNLSEVLETAVDTMRDRGRLTRHVRALSAEGRLSAYVLIGMPLCLSAWMFIFRRDYIEPLYTQPFGLVMLGAGVMMISIGSFWISRIIKVEV